MGKIIFIILLVYCGQVFSTDYVIKDDINRVTGYVKTDTRGNMVFKDKKHRILYYITPKGIMKDKKHRKIGKINEF